MRTSIRSSRECGFTILEVVMAMGILTLGLSAVLGLFTFGAALGRRAALQSAAAASLDGVVADLEETLFPLQADGSAGEPAAIVDRAVPHAPGVVYSAEATPNPGDPLEYRVDVEVSWQSAGVRRVRRFTTLLLREVPFGERMRERLVEEPD